MVARQFRHHAPQVRGHDRACVGRRDLHAGEFFGSGTVGNGCGLEQGRFLKPNDVVELEIDGLGVLRNRFVKAD
jgi:2-keto-4-pentenoate hydratase/2-oxohepta-3-ene-1,7-dioic acid hydratase in catechol pathway